MLCFTHFSCYKCLLGKLRMLDSCVQENCPQVHSVCFDSQKKWILTRYVLSCLYGIFIAFIFWEFILTDIGLSVDALYWSLIIFILCIGLGYTYSKRIRCIVLLTCLNFWGKSGRSFLRAIIYALIISGPVQNMADNGRETIRVFSCSAVLTYNLTKTRFDLMTRPFVNALTGMKNDMSTIKDTFKNMESVVKPIVEEIEEPDRIKRQPLDVNTSRIQSPQYYQEKYMKKIEERCRRQLEKGEMRCKDAFADAYQSCYDKLPAVIDALLCWPMKLTVVCNMKLIMGGRNICDAKGAIDERLGENYYNLKMTENNFIANLSSVRLSYTLVAPKEIPGVKNVDETRKQLTEKFIQNKKVFDYCMKIVKRFLAFIFLKVVIYAIMYQSRYVSNIEADNIYLTDYFKRIDERRKINGKHSLLPLKKVESREIIDPSNFRQSKSERNEMFLHILKLCLELITALLFLLLDHIIYELLDIVRDNARIEYFQDGEHELNVHVNGTGIVANLIRATLKGFNTKETIHVRLTNEQCLPVPLHLPVRFYIKFSTLYVILIMLICNQRIILRMRHVICAYFYEKQEKRRVLHLYNKLLKRRKQIFTTMVEVVRKEVEKHRVQHRLNVFVVLRMRHPILFGWIRKFPFGRRSCLICREPEPTKYDKARPYNFADCKTQTCYFTYCEECWFEAGERCLACEIKRMKTNSKISVDEYCM